MGTASHPPGQPTRGFARPTGVRTLTGLLLLAALTGCSDAPATDTGPGAAPAPTVTTTVTAAPDPAVEQPDGQREDLPVTGPPRIAYVDGHVLRHPDGRTVRLPRQWRVSAITAYAGGYLVSDDRTFEGSVGMERLDREGRVVDRWTGTGPPLVSRDGRVAWVSLVVAESGRTG